MLFCVRKVINSKYFMHLLQQIKCLCSYQLCECKTWVSMGISFLHKNINHSVVRQIHVHQMNIIIKWTNKSVIVLTVYVVHVNVDNDEKELI